MHVTFAVCSFLHAGRPLSWEVSMGRPAALVALLAAAALCACGRRDAEIRRARLEAERQGLATTLDHLEDRLIVNQARVRFWREMQQRHESISAVACASQDAHAADMARLDLDPPGGRSAAGRRGTRVARAAPASMNGMGGGGN
jgi:hypothetical protein